jgi:hypothetical protein
MASFDLFRNPFVLLGLDLSASAKQIADAYEDAVAEGRYSQTELTAARQALLRPLLRLEAEISSLLDTPRRDWRPILTAVGRSKSLEDLRRAFRNVPPLSRSNILAHVSSRISPDASTLTAWADAQSGIKPDVVYSEIERCRKIAGFVQPDRAALSSALNALREQQSRALFDGFAGPSDAINVVTICTDDIISSGDDSNIDALASLLLAYNRYIDQELSFRRERIEATAKEFRVDLDGPGNLALVIDSLKFWNLAAKPLQLLEAHKSRSEPNSQAVFQEVRNLAIELANDHSRFDLSLSLTRALQEIFVNLPRAGEQLSEDENTLKDRIVTSKIDPLATVVGKLDDDLPSLAGELRKTGFGRNCAGVTKPLRDAFITVVKDSKGSAAEGLPWLMLRSIVVKLNNALEDPDSALALVKGLTELSRELGASDEVLTRLNEDNRAIERKQLEKKLIGHLETNRSSEALAAIENLLQDYKSPEERDTLQKLKGQLEQKRTGQYLRWGFWAAVVVGGIVLANTGNSPSQGPRAPSYTFHQSTGPTPAVPTPIRSYAEEMPPVGTDMSFSEANVRYCEFQKARLQFIRPRISTNFQSDQFNRLVDDFNSRCGSYRYLPSVRSSIQVELAQKQSDLEAQAQRIVNSWGAR